MTNCCSQLLSNWIPSLFVNLLPNVLKYMSQNYWFDSVLQEKHDKPFGIFEKEFWPVKTVFGSFWIEIRLIFCLFLQFTCQLIEKIMQNCIIGNNIVLGYAEMSFMDTDMSLMASEILSLTALEMSFTVLELSII